MATYCWWAPNSWAICSLRRSTNAVAGMARTLPAGCKKGGVVALRGRRNVPFTPMATCLVTGGAGFLGSHLCDELLRRGHRVICVDNLETGSLTNIEHIRVPEFVHLNTDIITPYFVDEPVDFVYHLASPASPIDYLR